MAEKMVRKVSFGITREYITQIVREQFFINGMGYDKAMEILTGCMGGTGMEEAQLKRYAEDVLLGRAEFKGSTADSTFHMTTYDAGEEPEMTASFRIFEQYSRMKQKLAETEKELDKMREWYAVAMEHVPSHAVNDVLKETGQPIESSYGSSLLDSFMERMLDEEEHTTGDYGWLAPDGEFHEVEWCQHQEWAEKHIRENMTEEEWLTAGVHMPGQVETSCLNTFGDYLVERGWVLLHNPSQGLAFPTRNPLKEYTKAQKEFLYDYYMERGKEKEASIYNHSSRKANRIIYATAEGRTATASGFWRSWQG